MKKIFAVVVALFALASVSAWAQDDFPKAEVFGGFSVMSVGEDGDRWNPLGFQASAAGNFHKNVGIVGDFGGQYKDGGHVYEYLFGPRFTSRMDKANAFAHVLFGGITTGGEGESESAFAMGFGGGVDVNVNERFAVRAIQFDWIPLRHRGQWYSDQIRFGFGIIFKK